MPDCISHLAENININIGKNERRRLGILIGFMKMEGIQITDEILALAIRARLKSLYISNSIHDEDANAKKIPQISGSVRDENLNATQKPQISDSLHENINSTPPPQIINLNADQEHQISNSFENLHAKSAFRSQIIRTLDDVNIKSAQNSNTTHKKSAQNPQSTNLPQNVQLNINLSVFISLYAERNFTKAIQFFKMHVNDHPLDFYNAWIDASIANRNKFTHIHRIVLEMESLSIIPNEVTLASLLTLCKAKKNYSYATHYFDLARQSDAWKHPRVLYPYIFCLNSTRQHALVISILADLNIINSGFGKMNEKSVLKVDKSDVHQTKKLNTKRKLLERIPYDAYFDLRQLILMEQVIALAYNGDNSKSWQYLSKIKKNISKRVYIHLCVANGPITDDNLPVLLAHFNIHHIHIFDTLKNLFWANSELKDLGSMYTILQHMHAISPPIQEMEIQFITLLLESGQFDLVMDRIQYVVTICGELHIFNYFKLCLDFCAKTKNTELATLILQRMRKLGVGLPNSYKRKVAKGTRGEVAQIILESPDPFEPNMNFSPYMN